MTTVRYICASSNRTLRGIVDHHTVWFEFHEVAHLFGTNLEQAAKLLRRVDATGEIDAAIDVRRSDLRRCLLSQRAVVSVGYHMNYGRATAFRRWCASGFANTV
jgi:prophage antirepressor-like protein